ncbi:60S ribosomal protein L4-1-like [Orbicella faveolata]|nr:60S ribosomal protein L4-1-like [Orbicella faveolata]
MSNADLNRLINSEEIQSVIRPAGPSKSRRATRKKNPLKNIGIMMKLNPHAKSVKRAEMLTVERRRAAKEAVLSKKREGK